MPRKSKLETLILTIAIAFAITNVYIAYTSSTPFSYTLMVWISASTLLLILFGYYLYLFYKPSLTIFLSLVSLAFLLLSMFTVVLATLFSWNSRDVMLWEIFFLSIFFISLAILYRVKKVKPVKNL